MTLYRKPFLPCAQHLRQNLTIDMKVLIAMSGGVDSSVAAKLLCDDETVLGGGVISVEGGECL